MVEPVSEDRRAVPLKIMREVARKLCDSLPHSPGCVMSEPHKTPCTYANCAVMRELREVVRKVSI